MKKTILLYTLLLILFSSCKKDIEKYPIYSLKTIRYVPDSLKTEQREWIKETVRASNQNLSAGDYENIDETIVQVERTSENLFEITVVGLRKKVNDDNWDDIELKPNELNDYEKKIIDSLLLKR
tara:strand:- start:77 stop:448 length:372 start_codon:yes stop_codon:yes gene_type:complete